MHFVGNLDKSIYRCITEDITTNAVVITDERIQHIEDHHPGEYEEILSSPLGESVPIALKATCETSKFFTSANRVDILIVE